LCINATFIATFVENNGILLNDFIATKSCPSYEFLVVFGQVRVCDRKSAGRVQIGLVCGAGWVQVKSVQARGGSGEDFWNSCRCGAGAHKKFQPMQDSSPHRWEISEL